MDTADFPNRFANKVDLDADASKRIGGYPLLRPTDAATLIVIDRSGDEPAVLMGKRHIAHAFMPDLYVFPGGRRDPHDGRVPVAGHLDETVTAKLMQKMASPASAVRAQALATTAIRETYEEVGLLIAAEGRTINRGVWKDFADRGLAPMQSKLRFIARAITPPRQKRRFDTRFFACFRDEIGFARPEASNELVDLRWVRFSEVEDVSMPRITLAVIEDLRQAMLRDAALPFGGPVPFYQSRYGRRSREIL